MKVMYFFNRWSIYLVGLIRWYLWKGLKNKNYSVEGLSWGNSVFAEVVTYRLVHERWRRLRVKKKVRTCSSRSPLGGPWLSSGGTSSSASPSEQRCRLSESNLSRYCPGTWREITEIHKIHLDSFISHSKIKCRNQLLPRR